MPMCTMILRFATSAPSNREADSKSHSIYPAEARSRIQTSRLSPRVSPQQVPTVPLEIQKYRESAVWLIARRRDELHAGRDHALVGSIEIVDAQEHSDATGELLTHNACLFVAVGTRQQDACLAPSGANHNPTLWPTIIGQRRRVFHDFELQHVNEETDGCVVVPDHQRDEFEMRHRASSYS